MRIHAVLILGALASTASANTHRRSHVPDEPPAFRFRDADRLDIDHAELALTTEGGELRGSLELELSTSDSENSDRSIMIGVPRGTEIRTLAVTIAGERIEAAMALAGGARRAYENTVDRATDPALLEWVSSAGGQTWLRLRVFPVTPQSPATIRLGLGMPHAKRIAIDPGELRIGSADITVDDEVAGQAELDTRLALDITSTPTRPTTMTTTTMRPQFVRPGRSLVAGPTIIAGREECPVDEVCLRMTYRRVRISPPTRTWHARGSAHRMRLTSRSRQLGQIRLAP